MKSGKWVPWRICAGVLGVLAIVYMWSTKDLAAAYSHLPAEAAVPMIITNLAVTLAKVGLIAGTVWVFKSIAGKLAQRKNQGE
jgi:hypothetical protein